MKMIEKKINKNNNEFQVRLNKLQDIKRKGIAFPNNFKTSDNIYTIKKKYISESNEKLKKINKKFCIAGRIVNQRKIGQVTFLSLQDINGTIQIYIKKQVITKKIYDKEIKKLDLGDIIGVKGKLFKTITKELTIYCEKFQLLTKCLRSLPDKFHGLANKEIKYRKRYLDLITNRNICNIFKKRFLIIKSIRKFMDNNDFIEVETPMMQNIPGGAIANPFITYHKSLNINLYLRISPELSLKQLIIGGFNKIFEINRNFRNEGLSLRHNPEFTMMELYISYITYVEMMQFAENLLKYLVKKIFKKNKIKFKGYNIDFSKKFQILTMKESILKFYPKIKINDLKNKNEIIKIANYLDINVESNFTKERIILEIFEKKIENKLIEPTFITEYSLESSPLARTNDNNPNVADRFELFIGGMEIGNGFSELNDSEDQSNRFKKQYIEKYKNKNIEKQFYDKEYIKALEYGLPPTAGMGIGIDRIVMLLTNSYNIKDVILFPILKPIK
ncbi:lysine--tRNA ligase [Buchnera aphidicola]|uniref:lysine--tRNA ligase n=1 Tax=Buchnera aphidicola TaxID=9 RepID=UPI0034643262